MTVQNKNLKRLQLLICLFIVGLFFSNCKKMVAVNPPSTSITGTSVYTSDATAIAVLNGLYTKLSGINSGGSFLSGAAGLSYLAGLSADEFILFGNAGTSVNAYYTNNLSTTKGGFEHWAPLYSYIFTCNSTIEALSSQEVLSPSIRIQLLSEAKFLRALFYFYLVNCYGEVPLVLSTDYKTNGLLPKVPQTQVFDQIIKDLLEAQAELSMDYLNAQLTGTTTERLRPNKWVAGALLSRVYLFKGDWVNAEAQATLIINNNNLYDTVSLSKVFLKNSKEAIWQLQPVTSNPTNTLDGRLFIIPAAGPSLSNPVYLSNHLLSSFESGDMRKNNWVGNITASGTTYYFPYKYKVTAASTPVTEYQMVLRLAEQFLIRAEARAQQNNIAGSQADLNIIRKRAGLPNTSSNDKNSLLASILHERQVELFTELGHRWFDLKRTGNVNAVMTLVTPMKASGAPWRPFQALYPIPQIDIERDPNLIQNPGY